MKAFRDYFAEYPDQVAVDDSFEKVGPAAAKLDLAFDRYQRDNRQEA